MQITRISTAEEHIQTTDSCATHFTNIYFDHLYKQVSFQHYTIRQTFLDRTFLSVKRYIFGSVTCQKKKERHGKFVSNVWNVFTNKYGRNILWNTHSGIPEYD